MESVYQEKSPGYENSSTVHTPQVRNGWDDIEQNMFKGTAYVDFVTLRYFDNVICYVCSVIFFGAAVLKDMD